MSAELRRYLTKRKEQLKEERTPWEKNWKEAQKFILPVSGRFMVEDTKAPRNHNHIINNTGTIASRTLASGLMSGLTSPARPWFKLSHPDTSLNQYEPVKLWLEEVTKRMRYVFMRSNLYQVLPSLYREEGVYGIGAIIPEPHFENIVHFKQLTVGEYYISSNSNRQVDSVYRTHQKTVKQLVGQFGLENVSERTRQQYLQKNYELKIVINHLVEPNFNRNYNINNNKNMEYKSTYWEDGGNNDEVLKQSGFERFPMMIPRWDVMVGDTYGYGPASEALGDVKQLQHQEKHKGLAIEKMVNPPLAADSNMRGDIISNAPSSVTYIDTRNPNSFGMKEAYQVRTDVSHLTLDIKETEQRIKTAFYSDLFLMISDSDRRQITAYEVAQKNQEKLIMLGPVLQRFNDELLKPLIDWTFNEMFDRGFIPPAPPELQGKDISVEFISLLAQAQEMVGIGAIERFVGFASNLATVQPNVIDKINFDKTLDEYSEITGVPAGLVNSDDEVKIIREQRAEQQRQQQMAEMMPAISQGAQAAKTLSETDTAQLREQLSGGIM